MGAENTQCHVSWAAAARAQCARAKAKKNLESACYPGTRVQSSYPGSQSSLESNKMHVARFPQCFCKISKTAISTVFFMCCCSMLEILRTRGNGQHTFSSISVNCDYNKHALSELVWACGLRLRLPIKSASQIVFVFYSVVQYSSTSTRVIARE